MHIKIGTRGSRLALWQAYYVENILQKGGLTTEIVLIDTKGDQILDRSLSKIGSKGVFTQELEDQLRDGRIDIAVHSAKDLQSELDDDLQLIAFTERERVNDVLVSHNQRLSLGSGETFVVGTSSTRRVAMLKHFYPHIRTVDMRGNLQTRLRKLEEGQCDAILLAFAGVHRMEYDGLIAEHLSLDEFTPAVGQGSVAIECSQQLDEEKRTQLRALLNHADTETCLLAERAFLRRLQGGCSVPVFGLAGLENDTVTLKGGVVRLDGSQILKQTQSGPASAPENIGIQLAETLLSQGAAEILAAIKQNL
ncbi:hydroxymethylbilane synthase [Runella slithyformis]|uniref:Porphobilinogen deaminase n=1 Tax=Runella slithyformis (strain ATCC 29530 / DSM 19594 / LMG 11500 / NCIMB 11436 / LSU 4) TaxID=761193 RepID=A0A7U4E5U1_RUNSL|nr:hydroxymethylbilane synthase [Runella slithyformis]AEI48926.1 Porphobilinogen deaminase [Runella slithyformis DSM 19594]